MNYLKLKILTFSVLCFILLTSAFVEDEMSWKAKWISTEQCQSATNTWLAYRKTVNIEEIPAKALARIAVDSKYWLWINGKSVVFEGGLKRTANPLDTYYDEVDIAPFLQSGENIIAVLVCYFGKTGFSHNSSGRAGLLFDCQQSGLELVIDDTWSCGLLSSYQLAGEPYPNFRLPESSILYDARKDIGSWQTDKNIRLGRANIILIIADDLGYGELCCQGNMQIHLINRTHRWVLQTAQSLFIANSEITLKRVELIPVQKQVD